MEDQPTTEGQSNISKLEQELDQLKRKAEEESRSLGVASQEPQPKIELNTPEASPTETPITPHMIPPKKGGLGGLLKFLVVLMVMAIVIVIGYMYRGRISIPKTNTKPIPTVVESIPTQTPEPHADWEKYLDSSGVYGFSYPKEEFTIKDYVEGVFQGVSITHLGSNQKNAQLQLSDGVVLRTILITGKDNDAKAEAEENRKKAFFQPDVNTKLSETTTFNVAGKIGYKYTISGYGNAEDYYVDVGDDVVRIEVIYAGTLEDTINYKKLIDEVFTTLKLFEIPTQTLLPSPTDESMSSTSPEPTQLTK